MNKKIFKRVAFISATAVMAAATLMGASCNENKRRAYNPDKDPLVFSSQDFDKVFNPFYATSAMDGNAVGMTQIGMIGNNEKGEPTYGEKEAVVTLDLQIEEIKNAAQEVAQTEYYFVLKNNVRFSNGSYLTMKDVLFNMYVYLDPAYTGSSTMYSTDIVGLKEYRTQSADEKEQDSFEKQFTEDASDRRDNLVTALEEILDDYKDEVTMTNDDMLDHLEEYMASNRNPAYQNVLEDYKRAEVLFKKELQDDFNNSKDTYADTIFTDDKGKEYKNLFTTDVEMFLYNEGVISWNKKDAKLEASNTNNVAEFKDSKKWTEQAAIDLVYKTWVPRQMDQVIQYWATSAELVSELAGVAMEEYFGSHEQTYKNISGIEFVNRLSPVTVNGKEYAVPQYNADGSVAEGNEVLKVTINEIDPKAIWNFAFGVAPMYYYSDEAHIKAFDYVSNFGVEYGSQTFMTKVVKDPDKIGVPVGAGPYMAAKASGSTQGVEAGDFLANNVMYFHSNPYYVMGEPLIKNIRYMVVSSNQIINSLRTGAIDFGEPNAKKEIMNQLDGIYKKGYSYTSIQTAGYGYVGVNAAKVPSIYVRRAIMHSIDTSLSVKYYDGTADAIYRSMSLSSWAYPDSALAYYPYIGGAIPDNLDKAKVYQGYKDYVNEKGYKSGQVMSEAHQIEYIQRLVAEGGYTIGGNGLYTDGSNSLKYTFTIAGQEKDHPSYTALYQAGQFLTNKVGGFQILTKTDANALAKLATGALTVWAAAWGSTIDPDMYQVYHMDSKATSVLNWGYKSILNNTSRYQTEYDIILELSDIIERARKSNDNTKNGTRAKLYEQALDLVMELAVELPMYQRQDLFAFNYFKIDTSTFTPEEQRSAFKGLTSDIHLLNLVTNLEK